MVEEFSRRPSEHRLTVRQELPAAFGSAAVRRTWLWRPGVIEIKDVVEAPLGTKLRSHTQLPPGTRATRDGASSAYLEYTLAAPSGAAFRIERALYSERYQDLRHASRAVVDVVSTGEAIEIEWVISSRDP
jgi:hypothetical protein